MDIIIPFDAERFYLGKLCPRGHDWNGTGKTLKRKNYRSCIQCSKEQLREARQKDPEKHNNYTRKYRENDRDRYNGYQRNARAREPEKHKAFVQKWRDNNREHIAEYAAKRYRANPEYFKERSRLSRLKDPEKTRERGRKSSLKARQANPEKYRQFARKYRLENPEKKRERDRQYRLNNPERCKENSRLYRLNNPEWKRLSSSRYRAQHRLVHRTHISPLQVSERMQDFSNKCCYCKTAVSLEDRKSYQLDHFLPVVLGGCDTIGNIVICCPACNASKGDRDPLQWFSRQPFFKRTQLLKILKVLGKTVANYNQLPLF